MWAYFGTVTPDTTRTENTAFPLGSDNMGFGGRCHCNRRGQIIQRYEKIYFKKNTKGDTF